MSVVTRGAWVGLLLGALAGCDDPKSLEWQTAHLADTNGLTRGKAIDGLSQAYRNTQNATPEAKKRFVESAISKAAAAYASDALKDASKDRRKLMEILANVDDPSAKPAFVHALKNYKPGETEEEVKPALRSILRQKVALAGDEDLGKALLEALKRVKFADMKSGEIGTMVGDGLSNLKPKGVKSDLLQIMQTANNGENTLANKELTARQAISAQILGDVGDKEIVPQLVDLMFDFASRIAKIKEGADEIELASPLTTGVSQLIGNALGKIGEPAVAPLMPFVKNDDKNETVKKVAEKFKGYVSPATRKLNKTAYVGIATQTVASIGLPQVAKEVAAIVRDDKTKDEEREKLVGLLVSLPSDDDVIATIKAVFDKTKSSGLKEGLLQSSMRFMEPSLTDWLIASAEKVKNEERARLGALASAEWLAPKAKMDDVKAAFQKAGQLDKPDATWNVKLPTTKDCDPKGKDAQEKCGDHPDLKGADNKTAKFVYYEDKTPKNSEVLALIQSVTNKCDTSAQCYLDEFKAAVGEVDKQGLTKVTREGTDSGIKMQKAIWMFAAYAKEDDMVNLVRFVPSVSQPAARSFAQMALDKNLKQGSEKVADEIAKVVKEGRDKGSETANREAAQLEPIANKLRVRVAANKK